MTGQLMAILEQSGVSARICLDKVPILPGAEKLSAEGVRSKLTARSRCPFENRSSPDMQLGIANGQAAINWDRRSS